MLRDRNTQIEGLKSELDLKSRELDDWKLKYKDLETRFNAMKADYERQIGDLNLKLAAYDRDLNDWRAKFARLESDFNDSKSSNSGFENQVADQNKRLLGL